MRYVGVQIITSIKCKDEKDMAVEMELVIPDQITGEYSADSRRVKIGEVSKLWDHRQSGFLSDADVGSRPLLGEGGADGLKTEVDVAAGTGEYVGVDSDSQMG